jgi:hypothetical protein
MAKAAGLCSSKCILLIVEWETASQGKEKKCSERRE